MERNESIITYFGQKAKVACDAKCDKAWGVIARPKVVIDELDDDDFYFLADNELGTAPKDPGTYEGGDGKPNSPDKFPNKWCVRQCERCALSDPGMHDADLDLPDWSIRNFNKPWKGL